MGEWIEDNDKLELLQQNYNLEGVNTTNKKFNDVFNVSITNV